MPIPRPRRRPHAAAERHLAAADPVLAALIEAVGPCTLRPDPDLFAVLARFVVYQQISTRAADSICRRLAELCDPDGLTHDRLRAATDDELRACGLSAPKRRTLREIADHPNTSPAALAALASASDEEVSAALLPVRGIGPWTVHMTLMFGLGRPDVLPVGDLGLRVGVRDRYGFAETPTAAEVERVAAAWRPYRTAATWYLWRSRGLVPQSE